MSGKPGPDGVIPFDESLTAVAAANSIRSARMNARDLMETAELLFTLKRFAHSQAFSILAIEEAAKVGILIMIFLEIGGDRQSLWRQFRSHRAKTSWLNPAIESRIRAVFPGIPHETAAEIGKAGPGPDVLETNKQRAFYSDCVWLSGSFESHYPALAEWRVHAWERLCEAQAIISGLRDYSPDELGLWHSHVGRAIAQKKSPLEVLPELHKDLLSHGFVQDGWWKTLLEDAERERKKSNPSEL